MLQEELRRTFVSIPKEKLNCSSGAKITRNDFATYVLKELAKNKVNKYGYVLALTKLISVGRSREDEFYPNHVLVPAWIRVRTFLPVSGEIFTGIVHRICPQGVFLKSGPMNMVYLPSRKMPNYEYVPGEIPSFVREDLSRVEIDVVVRYKVFAAKWVDDHLRAFRVIASIDADGLGPVSTISGLDELAF